MQGYHLDLHPHHHAMPQSSGLLHDHESPCGSDDEAGYLVYPDSHRIESGMDDDPNAALTSQTLNADGTPKRPMNAFMIFARRRRPQVAAENQAMRTGDVSKILSREWNGMSLSEKQFYLDQAKQLKDNFNQKYPDYVYKRRPNNSRKRRKPDPTPGLSADQASVDDHSGSADYSDVSPVDVVDIDDSHLSGQDVRYASSSVDPSGAAYPNTQSRASSYQSPDVPYRPLGDTPVSYMPRAGRVTPDTGLTSSISSAPRGSDHSAAYYYPYLSTQAQQAPQQQQQQQQQQPQHAQSSSYFLESGSAGQVWSGARDDQGRMPWSQNSQDLGGDDRPRGYPQHVSSHAWANTGASEGIPPASSSGPSTTSFGFPTLNSPFFPPQNSAQEGFSSSSIQPISVPSQHYGAVPGNPVSGRSYSSLQQAYGSGSPSAVGSYQPQARTISLNPPGQPVSYPNVRSASPLPPAGSGADPSQMRYWSRERSNP